MAMIKNIVLLLVLSMANITLQAQEISIKMNSKHEKIIDDFAIASANNKSFQNGLNVFIEKPESDEDALYQGFRIAHTDREYNGGWEILGAKDIVIKDYKPLSYRAILYEYKEKYYIVLVKEEKKNKYYFRIFNAVYGG